MHHVRMAAASVLVGWAGAFHELAKAVRPRPQRKRKPAWYDEAMQQQRRKR